MKKNQVLKSITILIALAIMVVSITGILGIFPQSYFSEKSELRSEEKNKVEIYEKDSSYNHLVLSYSLQPKASYQLSFGEVKVTQGDTQVLVAALFDQRNQTVLAQKVISLEKEPLEWNFITPEDTEGVELLLYPNLRGQSEWIGIEATGVSLIRKEKSLKEELALNEQNLLPEGEKHSIYLNNEENDYSYKLLSPLLEEKEEYVFTMKKASLLGSNTNIITIGLFDEEKDEVLEAYPIQLEEISEKEGYRWNFTVPKEGLKVIIYGGEAGNTKNIIAIYEELSLMKKQ